MGYDSRIYLTDGVRDSGFDGWCHIVGMIECAKSFGYMDGAMDALKPVEGMYFYADGDEQITHDRYGDPITIAPIEEFVAGVRASKDFEPDGYADQRLKVIEAFTGINPSSLFKATHVIHFGH